MNQYKNVNELWAAVVNGDTKPSVSDFFRYRSILYLSNHAISRLQH